MFECLDENCIRLLDVSGDPQAPMLLITSICDAPPFEAVSYHCGDPSQRHSFRVEGAELHVTSNLYEFLLEYRARDIRGRLWADQVCIDQDSPKEKGQQIPLMGDIYHAAQQAIIWFGRSSASVKAALEVLPEVAAVVRHMDLDNSFRSAPELKPEVMAFRSYWAGFHELWSHPWFCRLWTFQESILAERLVCWCGSISFEWADLVTLNRFIMLAQLGAHPDTLEWNIQAVSVQNMVNVNLIEVERADRRSAERLSGPQNDYLGTLTVCS